MVEKMSRKNLAYINKDMLVWARSETPFALSPDQLSLRFPRINAEKLRKWESGEELPSIREAKDLAKIYKLPFACFFLSETPTKKPRRYTDRRTALGTEYDEMSYELWEEISRICADRDTLIEFCDEEVYPSVQMPIVDDSDSVEKIAAIIREFLKLPASFRYKKDYGSSSFNYFRDVLERHGIIIAQISSVSLAEMKGLSIYEDRFPIIAINNKDYERAKTFSLFHELAHLIRRSSSLCLIDDNERNDEEEKICDRIAAEVLMERTEFKRIAGSVFSKVGEWNSISLMFLADKFGVSTVSAFRRLHDLSIISDSQYYDMYRDINAAFEDNIKAIEAARAGKDIPFYFHVRYVNSHGHLLPRMIVSAQSTGKITMGEACKIMSIKSKYYGDIARAVMA